VLGLYRSLESGRGEINKVMHDRMLELLRMEGPMGADLDFELASIKDLVLFVLHPIFLDFNFERGHNIC